MGAHDSEFLYRLTYGNEYYNRLEHEKAMKKMDHLSVLLVYFMSYSP